MVNERIDIPTWKRMIDLLSIVFLSPILIIIFLIISIYIKLVSKGPIFFKQERIGLNENPFMCYKFRTMLHDTDTNIHKNHFVNLIESDKPMSKIDKHDSRLIPGANLLRSMGLDELPQLINIVKGEMSLVGPRPCIRYEYERFKNIKTWYNDRFKTLPGITGLWQVCGKNKTTFDEMMKLDSYYANNLNFISDIGILANTMSVIINQVLESKTPKPTNINVDNLAIFTKI